MRRVQRRKESLPIAPTTGAAPTESPEKEDMTVSSGLVADGIDWDATFERDLALALKVSLDINAEGNAV